MSRKVWNEFIYPFLNFNGASLGIDKQFHPTLYNECNYLSILVLELYHFSKRGHSIVAPWCGDNSTGIWGWVVSCFIISFLKYRGCCVYVGHLDHCKCIGKTTIYNGYTIIMSFESEITRKIIGQTITAMSHKRHGVWICRKIDC